MTHARAHTHTYTHTNIEVTHADIYMMYVCVLCVLQCEVKCVKIHMLLAGGLVPLVDPGISWPAFSLRSLVAAKGCQRLQAQLRSTAVHWKLRLIGSLLRSIGAYLTPQAVPLSAHFLAHVRLWCQKFDWSRTPASSSPINPKRQERSIKDLGASERQSQCYGATLPKRSA